MNKKKFSILTIFLSLFLLSGCAKLWSPVFSLGKKTDSAYYKKYPYYNGTHQLCQYEGRHVHDPKLGPISITETDEEVIRKKYRYPGMEDQFKDFDAKVW